MLNRQAHEFSPATATATSQLARSFSFFVACFLLAARVTADESKTNPAGELVPYLKVAASAKQ